MVTEIRSLFKSLKNGDIQPIYFLEGDDYFLQDFVVNKIEEAMFVDGPVDKTLLIPDEMSGKEIITRLTEVDLFSSKKLFVLRNPQSLRDKTQKELIEYCSSPISSHCLVIIHDNFTKKRAYLTKLKAMFDTVSVNRPFENKLKDWARYFFQEKDKKVNNTVINTVIEIAGDSLHHVFNEIDKICLLTKDDEQITKELVYQFAGWNRDFQRWEFILSVANKNLQKAIIIGNSLLKQNETILSLLYPLTSFFQEILFEKMSPGTFRSKVGYIPLAPSVKKKLPYYSKSFSQTEIESALGQLGELDYRIKSTTVSDESELVRLLFNIIGNNG